MDFPKIVRKSVKHCDKLGRLEALNEMELTKVGPPVKSLAMTESFLLGTGSKGTCVYVGIMEDGSEVAVKRMLIQTSKDKAENEKAILTLIHTKKSPFIVSYRSFLKDSTFMYLVVDLCEETLKDHIRCQEVKFVRENGRRMIIEILTGLEFLHSQGILHRDLKPSNVLVDVEDHMKLADFGISRVLSEDETTVETNANGTQGWMPSEVIETGNKGGKGRFKRKSDVQVVGMIAHFILSKGEHPFGSAHERMGNILKGNPVNLKNLNDPDARQFVSKLISHNISDRPYASEALGFPYINDGENSKQTFKSVDEKSDNIESNFKKSILRFSSDDDESESLDETLHDLSGDDFPDGDNPEDYEGYSPDEHESNNGNPDDDEDEDNPWNENEDFDEDENNHSDPYENYGNSDIDYECEDDEDDIPDEIECYVDDGSDSYENYDDEGDDNDDENDYENDYENELWYL